MQGLWPSQVENPQKHPISEETQALIGKWRLEKIPLAGIARVAEVSERWLQNHMNEKYHHTPQKVVGSKKSQRRLSIECDELWSFVLSKKNQPWFCLAIDRETREIVGVAIGDRSRKTAKELWDSWSGVYRQCAVSYTDFW